MSRQTGLAALAFVVCSISLTAPAAGGVPILPRRTCEVPSDHYPVPGDHAAVDLDGIHGTASTNENGQVVELRILDCDGDGTPELFIPTSHARSRGTPAVPARFWFRSLCGDGVQPSEVTFTFSQGGLEAKWTAFDIDGNLVDSAHSSVSGTPQQVTLEHPGGVFRVEVVGIRICIERICYRCEDERPRPSSCVDPDDYYAAEETASQVNLGPVFILEGKFPGGEGGGLRVEDCDEDGELDVFVRWAENPAAPALISTVVCDGENPFPQTVSISFSQETPLATWNALDSVGAIVDTVVSAGAPLPQAITLEHAAGIRAVQLIGAKICISEICWRCEEERPRPSKCVAANDHYTAEETASQVDLGPVFILEGKLPNGNGGGLRVEDCDRDGELDVVVAWADNPAAPALISTVVCDGENPFPIAVSMTFSHETPIATWNALDSVGAIVDTVVSAGSPASQTITLEHQAGIRAVQLIGTRICIAEICWRCEESGRELALPRFLRGDSNDDSRLGMSDAIATLGHIFLGTGRPGCDDAADADDDGSLTIGDVILTLNFLYNGATAPPGSSACGADPTKDSLDCESYGSCVQAR